MAELAIAQTERIEICGGMAAGKTTLAQLLEQKGYPVVYDDFENNPFLKDFYKGKQCAFESEVVFAMLHYHGVKNHPAACFDYSIIQDLAFADVNLHHGQHQAFATLYEWILEDLKFPSHIIYVKCRAEEAFRRLKIRSREIENGVELAYLEQVVRALEDRLTPLSDVLVIDSEEYDFATRKEDREKTMALICRWLEGSPLEDVFRKQVQA